MAITLPNKNNKDKVLLENQKKITAEQKAEEFIKGGGTVPKTSQMELPASDEIKNFNIKIIQSTLSEINSQRLKRPKSPYSKKSISIQNWIIEAIEEKLQRNKKL